MKLGTLITQFRTRNNISQREFARRCGLSNSLISILEKGINPQTGKEVSPDLETYVSIARAMGLSTQSLFEMLGNDAMVHLTTVTSNGVMTTPSNAEAQRLTEPVKILIRGVEKLTEEEQRKLLNLTRLIFPGCFEEE